jgi:phage gp46-like protein
MAMKMAYSNEDQRGDISQDALGTLEFDEGLETPVAMSLFTDRRAEPADVPNPEDRRGWWGDTFADVEGDQIGSRLWLLGRAKTSDETLELAKLYAEESLAWLIEDRVATSVTATPFFLDRGAGRKLLCITIEIVRPDQPAVRWIRTWDETARRVG